jgi:hypothetical protein
MNLASCKMGCALPVFVDVETTLSSARNWFPSDETRVQFALSVCDGKWSDSLFDNCLFLYILKWGPFALYWRILQVCVWSIYIEVVVMIIIIMAACSLKCDYLGDIEIYRVV